MISIIHQQIQNSLILQEQIRQMQIHMHKMQSQIIEMQCHINSFREKSHKSTNKQNIIPPNTILYLSNPTNTNTNTNIPINYIIDCNGSLRIKPILIINPCMFGCNLESNTCKYNLNNEIIPWCGITNCSSNINSFLPPGADKLLTNHRCICDRSYCKKWLWSIINQDYYSSCGEKCSHNN